VLNTHILILFVGILYAANTYAAPYFFDPYEPNDSIASAAPLNIPVPGDYYSISMANFDDVRDYDNYAFGTNAPVVFDLTLFADISNYDFFLNLYTADAMLIASGVDSLPSVLLANPGDYVLGLNFDYDITGSPVYIGGGEVLPYWFTFNLSPASIPEPGTLSLLAVGVGLLSFGFANPFNRY